MKPYMIISVLLSFAVNAFSQSVYKYSGSYIRIDTINSTSYKSKDSFWHKNIDTMLLTLNPNNTFIYKWHPLFGRNSDGTSTTTGHWEIKKDGVMLNSKYQNREYRFNELYNPKYGDSIVKVFVQTYDSFPDLFVMQFIGVFKDSDRLSKMIFKDKEDQYKACSATFKLKNIDSFVLYGDFRKMPIFIPQNKKSNQFLIQFNFSADLDYQYFHDFTVNIEEGNAVFINNRGRKKYLHKIKE